MYEIQAYKLFYKSKRSKLILINSNAATHKNALQTRDDFLF